ncbi:MFS transporter [Saccharospirillum sp. HFRX-1]|uniref:MFS transporter n=1 Tax=unclassified Saccharospirillum TaxID=2633430 RepID=UPI00371D8533
MSNQRDDDALGWMYDKITGEEDARVCKDIPDSACQHQPRNFFGYLAGNTFSKMADELSSARLILPWLFAALGAPMALVGFLVPIREAGVLMPQLLVAALVRSRPKRKGVWMLGALLSALALLAMAAAALTLDGFVAGLCLLVLLVIYSLARGLCSVAAKDVLGKTVSKTRRGTLMGYSSGVSGLLVLALGLGLMFFPELKQNAVLLGVFLLVAALCWAVGLLGFAFIREQPGSTEGGGNALQVAVSQLALLRSDQHFRRFVWARALLLSLALAPPFYVVMVQQQGGNWLGLGALLMLSGLAASCSGPVWGRLSDRSSRWVMALAASGAALAGLGVWISTLLMGADAVSPLLIAVLYFVVMICHGGVRLGRKAYLVDLANADNRAAYVAVSNTLIGGLMLLAGWVGLLGDQWGPAGVLGVLGAVAMLAVIQVLRLPEVE